MACAGALACGAVSASELYNSKLKDINRKFLAIETESGGVFEKCKAHGVPALTIRGISDRADRDKSTLEADSIGAYRTIAARNAATFLRLQIQNKKFVANLLQLRGQAQDRARRSVVSQIPLSPLNALLDLVSQEIDARLGEISSELRLRAPGYRLPVPRVQRVFDVEVLAPVNDRGPEEISKIIEIERTLAIGIPKSYPDPSLPWVIARDLLSVKIGNAQLVPFVIDFGSIRPPRGDFRSGSSGQLVDVCKRTLGAKPVFIIDSVHLGSPTRRNHLAKLVREEFEAKFILIFRNEVRALRESEFIAEVGASVYRLREVPFSEIALFLQVNFGMTDTQADAIALKLKNTFVQFQLDAHPAYFAGISKEILWKILEANRRTELIGLAVSGFLSFVVADDQSDVSLSCSTRERFLRLLASEINVHKRSFDQMSLTAFVKEFAERHDFSLDVRQFINGFVDNGILSEFDDKIGFSLRFVEQLLISE